MSAPARPAVTIDLPSRYRVERVIGRGGAATVLAAHDLRLRRRVAIKVFTEPASTVEVLMAQEREAQLLAGLAHPGLVTVFDVASDAGVAGNPHGFLVMEYVDGPDLGQWLRSHRATVAQVAQLGVALCSALEFVHRSGVLHCDIKPSNVLLRLEPDGVLIPKLSDFGVAAVLQGAVPQGEFTVGTAAYLSPEQVEGVPLRAPSDTYALGLVLLEAATGHVAFPGGVVDSAFARLDRDPDIPTSLRPELASIFSGMTHRDPAERWTLQRAGAAFRALDTASTQPAVDRASVVAAGEEVESRPDLALDASEAAPALRTLGPGSRMIALERATELAARVTEAVAAFLITTDEGSRVLQAVSVASEHEALELAGTLSPDAFRGRDEVVRLQQGFELVSRPLTGSRAESLGLLAVLRSASSPMGDMQDAALGDAAFLAGQVVELRAAVRRALLAR